MAQINSFHGGATYPGQSVSREDLKSLTLKHQPTLGGPEATEVYNPLEEKEVSFKRLTFKKGGHEIGMFDPLGSDEVIEIPENEVELAYIQWNGGAEQIYKAIGDAIQAGKYPIVATSGSTTRYAPIVKAERSGYTFIYSSEDGFTVFQSTNNFDGTYGMTQKFVVYGSSDVVYIEYGGGEGWTQTKAALEAGKVPLIKWAGGNVSRLYTYAGFYTDGGVNYQFICTDLHDNTIRGIVIATNGAVSYTQKSLSGTGGGGLSEVIHDETLSGNGTEDSPLSVSPELSIVVSPPLDVVTGQVSAASGGQDTRPSMIGHAFATESIFKFSDARRDTFGFCNTNSNQNCHVLIFAVYRWDKDANELNLVAISDNAASMVQSGEVGYKLVPVNFVATGYYSAINAKAIHYMVTFCDADSLKLAGLEAIGSSFAMHRPYAMFKHQALQNATSPETIAENYHNIKVADFGFEDYQERVCVAIYHQE